MMKYDKDTIIDTAMQIILGEHCFFVNEALDNGEHIPRIVRIAQSAGKLLSMNGMNEQDIGLNIERIIQYGRQLFIKEWMKPFPGEDEPPCEEEAIEAFNRYLPKRRGEKRKGSSNK